MVKNKWIILPLQILAWTIIFVHSIVPHHHHLDSFEEKCISCDDHPSNGLSAFFSDHDHNVKHHSCHFQVDILTQISIDQVFIASAALDVYECTYVFTNKNYTSSQGLISNFVCNNKLLRAPPSVLIS